VVACLIPNPAVGRVGCRQKTMVPAMPVLPGERSISGRLLPVPSPVGLPSPRHRSPTLGRTRPSPIPPPAPWQPPRRPLRRFRPIL